MAKKIVILNGSPRPNGNTAGLIASFTEGAKTAGHDVREFRLQSMKIAGCIGCLQGGKDPASPCVQKDDMDKIYPAYVEADIVVLASPLYYWTISGQLKCAFDRLFAVAECDPNYANPKKDAILLMAAKGNDYGEVTLWYDRLLDYLGWKDRGKVLAGGVMQIGDIAGKPILDEARKLGAGIV
ncbi:MAG: flavodoxin family protein [Planctomycetes bacterium]|nr:flavodoxin family protein [Planctomycetota bacterium]